MEDKHKEHYTELTKKEAKQLIKINKSIFSIYKKLRKEYGSGNEAFEKAVVTACKVYAQAVMNDYKNRMQVEEEAEQNIKA